MTSARRVQSPRGTGWSPDTMLGVVGGGLALASGTFGIAMTLHGPVASWGKSGAFTIFAQFAPRDTGRHPPSITDKDQLDLTETATITRAPLIADQRTLVPRVRLEAASRDSATIAVADRVEVVHVGDTVPEAGKILAIVSGAKPLVQTSRGWIAGTGRP